ncbi:hypothetical protein BH23CHL8_BH23CHL8_31800 [soil metagenome]
MLGMGLGPGGGPMHIIMEHSEGMASEWQVPTRLEPVLNEAGSTSCHILHDGCVLLTPRGHSLASLSRYFRLNLLPKRRLLLDEYTDVLIDPFRESPLPETGASGGCVHAGAPSPAG